MTQRLVYLTSDRWQSICRYFWGRSWRSPPSSLCRRAAAVLHQTRSICSQTQLACSACLPRSRPFSKRAASARKKKDSNPREKGVVTCFCLVWLLYNGLKDEDDGNEVDLKCRCRSFRDTEAGSRCCMAGGRGVLQPITREKSDVMRADEFQHQDQVLGSRMRAPAEEGCFPTQYRQTLRLWGCRTKINWLTLFVTITFLNVCIFRCY